MFSDETAFPLKGSYLEAYPLRAVPFNFSNANKRFIEQSRRTLVVFPPVECAVDGQGYYNDLAEMT